MGYARDQKRATVRYSDGSFSGRSDRFDEIIVDRHYQIIITMKQIFSSTIDYEYMTSNTTIAGLVLYK